MAFKLLREKIFNTTVINDTVGAIPAKVSPLKDAVVEAIRPSNPRQVTIQEGRELLSIERNAIQKIELANIAKQARLDAMTTILGSQPDNPTINKSIMGLANSITSGKNHINALKSGAQEININGIDIVVGQANNTANDNPLNGYMDVQYHLSLTMISEADAIGYQRGGFESSGATVDINTLRATNSSRRSITLASTGDSITNSTSLAGSEIVDSSEYGPRLPNQVDDTIISGTSRNYYNITKMSVNNLMSPSVNNPLISTMLGMKMSVAEPHGFKLHEDIRDAGILLGYKDINPGRILYRVDIHFSGYDQDTGDWTDQIQIGRDLTTVSSIMAITDITAEITSSGTLYELDLMPAGHFAFRPEDFVVEAQTITSGTTFRDFLNNFSTALSDAKEKRTETSELGALIRNYEFYAPSALLDSRFDVKKLFNMEKQIYGDADQEHIIASGADIDIMTTLQGALANTLLVQEVFNADINNDNFLTPRIMFNIRFNTIYGRRPTQTALNDYQEITHQYIIEPYVTFKHGPVNPSNINAYVDPQNQLLRVRELIRMGMLRRIYNYIYTEENSEVIDFDIRLKTFYYNTLNTTARTPDANGISSSGAASDLIARTSVQANAIRILSQNTNSFPEVEETIQRIFGNYKYDISDSRSGADRLCGGFNDGPDAKYFGDTVSPVDGRRGDYNTYMSDYLSLELMSLDGMSVRGDPVWLLSPYANVGVGNLEKIKDAGVAGNTAGASGVINVTPMTDQIIFLKILPPDQNDIMNDNRTSASSHPSLIGGFYLVTDVISSFEGGRFTQSINGVKLDHLNYVEELFERSSSRGTPRTGTDAHREPVIEN